MSTRQTSNVPQRYEDFQPLVETKDTPQSLLLLVHLPGFAREHVGANYEAAFKRVRVYGERPIDNNRIKRFNVEYQVPQTCEVENLKGKFEEGAIITITIPKKPIQSVTSKEAAKQVTPPKSTPEDQKGISQEGGEKERKSEETSRMFEKDKNEISKKGTLDDDDEKKISKGQRESTKETQKEYQKDKEEIFQKGGEKERESEETFRMSEEDNNGISKKGTLDDDDDDEKKRDERKESKEGDNGKSMEEERKEPPPPPAPAAPAAAMVEGAEKPDMKIAEKEKKEMEVEGKSKEGNYGKTKGESSVGKGIRNMANSASQAVTKLANRFNEEDKQKLIYVGAAILVVAVGVYASFKLRSSRT